MGDIILKVDTREFEATRKAYMQYTKRDMATVLNTKAFFIARRAVLETPKANKANIARDLGRVIKTGKRAGQLSLKSGRWSDAPLAALIINKRRGLGRGLKGAEMEAAIRAMLAARLRSIGFIKSGWLPAIKALFGLAEKRGAPPQDRSGQQYGKPKGGAVPAENSGWNQRAEIWNSATTRRDKKQALGTYGLPALERAFAAEVASMAAYMERKMRESAQRLGIKRG